MKLDESCFGKKMTRSTWGKDSYFIPLAFIPNATDCDVIGLDELDKPRAAYSDDWEFYEEPKKKEAEVEIDALEVGVWLNAIMANHMEYIPDSGMCLKSGVHISISLFRSICDEVAKVIDLDKFNAVAKPKEEPKYGYYIKQTAPKEPKPDEMISNTLCEHREQRWINIEMCGECGSPKPPEDPIEPLFYTKPKKRIEKAPAVVFYPMSYGRPHITDFTYSCLEEAIKSQTSASLVLAWPASWDAEKGVWYYEYE